MTDGRGVSAYSLETSGVKKIVDTGENLLGITYDSIREKLYWSNHGDNIYRANKDGNEKETVLNTRQCKTVFSLATTVFLEGCSFFPCPVHSNFRRRPLWFGV